MSKAKNLATFGDNVDSSGTISGNFTVDSDTLYVDATNDRVGIGTTNPATPLETYGTIRSSATGTNYGDFNSLSGGLYISHRNGANDGTILFGGQGGGIFTERMRLSPAGNVGIGTASPAYKLDVNGDLRVQGNFTVDGTTTTINSTTLNVDDLNITVASGAADAAAADGAGLTVDGAGATLTYVNAGDNWSFNKDLNLDGDLTVSGGQIIMPTVATRDKYRVWNSSAYAIGMDNAISFGGLSDYAMTFQFSNNNARGFWFGDSSHTDAQGAMALTTNGKLTVAHSARVGYGETDTTTPGSTHALDVNGSIQDSQGNVRALDRTGINSTPYAIPANSTGKYFSTTTGASVITIDSGDCELGQIITIYNHLNTSVTISWTNMTNGVYIAGATTSKGTNGSVTLAGKGLVTILNDVAARLVLNGNVS